MSVETLGSESTVERFDKCIVGRLAWSREVECDTTLVSPQIQVARYKLGALVDPDGRRQPHLSPDSFQHIDDICAAEVEPRLQCRREPREGVDDR